MLCNLSITWEGFCGAKETESWTFLTFLCRLFPSSSWINSVCVCESLSELSLSCMVPLYFPLCSLTSSLRALSFMCLCLSVAGWPCEIALHTSLLFLPRHTYTKKAGGLTPAHMHAHTLINHTYKNHHFLSPHSSISSFLYWVVQTGWKVTRKLLRGGQYWLRTRGTFSQLDKLKWGRRVGWHKYTQLRLSNKDICGNYPKSFNATRLGLSYKGC